MSRGPVVGIDLGTTNSLVAIVDGAGVRILPNALGEDLTPSAVSADEGELLVGAAAQARAATHPEVTAVSFKRDMGTDRRFEIASRSFRPQELSGMVLASLKRDAEAALGQAVEEAVITVPAYFNETQRQATREAGEIAGFRVERLLNEPTAAAIAYGLHSRDREFRAVVLDLGGGTFDVTVLEIMEGVIEIQASAGDSRLGGDDFTRALAEALLEHQPDDVAAGIRRHPLAWSRVLAACERAKAALSAEASVEIALPDLPVGAGRYADIVQNLSREEAETLWEPLLERMKIPTRGALRDAGLAPRDCGEVLLVGGATRMPCVRRFAATLFQRMPSCHPQPERVVALGAALQAGLKSGSSAVEDLVVTDIAPFSLGIAIATEGAGYQMPGTFSPILERGTVIPISRSRPYTTAADGQTEILIEVYQGEHSLCRDNIKLGELRIDGIPPAPAGAEAVDIRFTYDLNALLEVEATLRSTGEKRTLLLSGSPGRLTPEQLEEAQRAMARLKFHPRDALPNTTALARAEALFAELRGADRERLAAAMAAFRGALESQDQELIREQRSLLDAVVGSLRGGV